MQDASKNTLTLVVAYFFASHFAVIFYHQHAWPQRTFSFLTFEIAISKVIAKEEKESSRAEMAANMGCMVLQGLCYMLLAIVFDHWRCKAHQGQDGFGSRIAPEEATPGRSEDVQNMVHEADRIWNQNEEE